MGREHLPLHRAVAVAERQHRLDGGGRRREALHRPAVPVGAVEGHLDDRDLAALAPQQRDRGMDGEGGGVMVGMAALIGMGQHDLGRPLQEQPDEGARDPRQMERRLLVGDAEAEPVRHRNAGQHHDALELPRRAAKAYSAAVAKPCLSASRGLRGAPSVTWIMVTPVSRGSCAPAPIVSSSGWATTMATLRARIRRPVARARRKAAARSGALSGCSLATARMPPVYTAACSSSSFDAPALGA